MDFAETAWMLPICPHFSAQSEHLKCFFFLKLHVSDYTVQYYVAKLVPV